LGEFFYKIKTETFSEFKKNINHFTLLNFY
jgi:hypothetical protein